jgi:hypothetical protein
MESRFQGLPKFDSHTAHLLDAIRLCLGSGHIVPSMMLLFAAINGMSWLYRNHEGRNTQGDFKRWVDDFLISHLESDAITSVDVYAARCALLHEQTTQSDAIRQGLAQPFLYTTDGGALAFSMNARHKRQAVFIPAEGFIAAFEAATARFRIFLATASSGPAMLERCKEWYDHGFSQARSVQPPAAGEAE